MSDEERKGCNWLFYNKNVYHCVANNGVDQVIIQLQRKIAFSQRRQFGTLHYYTTCKIKM